MMLYKAFEHYIYLREWTSLTASPAKSATESIEVLYEDLVQKLSPLSPDGPVEEGSGVAVKSFADVPLE